MLKNDVRNAWHSADFVPHWFVLMVMTFGTVFIGGMMYLGSVSGTEIASHVTCKVLDTYTGSREIDVNLDCLGHKVTINSGWLVLPIVSKHLTEVACEQLFADDSVQHCKPITKD